MTLSVLVGRVARQRPAPRPQLVAWTNHFLVRDGRTYAREALILFPGEDAPRLSPVRLPAVAA